MKVLGRRTDAEIAVQREQILTILKEAKLSQRCT
jgi:hypothetical protein